MDAAASPLENTQLTHEEFGIEQAHAAASIQHIHLIKKPEFKARSTAKVEPSRQISNVIFDKKKVSTTTKFPQYPKISSYGFKGTSKDLVEAFKTAQTTVRWLKKSDKTDDKKDKTKWCVFHDDHGHTTDNCITLKKKIASHVPKGNLKDILDGQVMCTNYLVPSSPF
ncbi:hypothetical protein L6452_14815 [Arctium lappa]|uniref:Uncharacterized protein n=1 Tax=Arctium lappa TaxID=4217 RepID=A0ACB9CM99_ARCLA|nr:hypothetical protein L6452_14815 [Arctium lappa]